MLPTWTKQPLPQRGDGAAVAVNGFITRVGQGATLDVCSSWKKTETQQDFGTPLLGKIQLHSCHGELLPLGVAGLNCLSVLVASVEELI